jgi:hypothetical protein
MTESDGAKSMQLLKVLDGTAAVALVTLYLTVCAFLSSAGYAFHFEIPLELVRQDFVTAAANWSRSAVTIGIPLGFMSLWSLPLTFVTGRLFGADERISPQNWKRVICSGIIGIILSTSWWAGSIYLFALGFRRNPEFTSFVATILALVGCLIVVLWLKSRWADVLHGLSPERRALLQQHRVALVSCAAVLGPVLSFWLGVSNAESERFFFVDTSDEPTLLLQYVGDSAVGYTYRIDGNRTHLKRLRVVSISGKSLIQVKLKQSPECCVVEPLPAPKSDLPNAEHGSAGAHSQGSLNPTRAPGDNTELRGGGAGGIASKLAPAIGIAGGSP